MRDLHSVAVAILIIFSAQDGYGLRFLPKRHGRADVECPPPSGSSPILLPNPDDCTTFYECNDMIPVLQQCPSTLLFCSELNSCQYITSEDCAYKDCRLPDSSDSTTQSTTVEVTTTQSTTIPTTSEPTTIPTTSEPTTTPSTVQPTTTTATSTLSTTTMHPTMPTSTTTTPIWTTLTSTTSQPSTTTTSTTERPETTSQSNALCPPSSGNPTNLVPDPDDCRAFYECSGDHATREYCPDPLWFCSEEHICTYQSDSRCRFDDCKKLNTMSVVVADPPTCPPPSGDGNVTLFPNADNCSTYYECDNGVLRSLDCPKGLLFCSEKSVCSWSWDTDCARSDCQIVELDNLDGGNDDIIIRSAKEEHITEQIIKCPPTDDLQKSYIPDPTNCTLFYECIKKVPIHERCPPNLWFCSEKDICTFAWDEDCKFEDCNKLDDVSGEFIKEDETTTEDPSTTTTEKSVKCDQPGELIVNPDDCHIFYECNNDNIPVFMQCPLTLLFCTESNACSYRFDSRCSYKDCKIKED